MATNLAMFSRETCQFVIVFIIDLLLLINYLVDFNRIKSIIFSSPVLHISVYVIIILNFFSLSGHSNLGHTNRNKKERVYLWRSISVASV